MMHDIKAATTVAASFYVFYNPGAIRLVTAPVLPFPLFQDQRRVGAAEAKGVGEENVEIALQRFG